MKLGNMKIGVRLGLGFGTILVIFCAAVFATSNGIKRQARRGIMGVVNMEKPLILLMDDPQFLSKFQKSFYTNY